MKGEQYGLREGGAYGVLKWGNRALSDPNPCLGKWWVGGCNEATAAAIHLAPGTAGHMGVRRKAEEESRGREASW